MIKLDHGPAPQLFESTLFLKIAKEAEAFFAQPMSKRAQKRYDFARFTGKFFPELQRQLKGRFHSKCAFCESFVENPNVGQFRPRQAASNLDGHVDPDCYWWLMFEWTNYLPACRECNIMKGNRFPIKGRRAKPRAVGAALARERPFLLDPATDDPSEFFLFLKDGRVTSEDERGQITIDVLNLNRNSLIAARLKDLQLLEFQLQYIKQAGLDERALGELNDFTSDATPFSAMRRQYVKTWALQASRQDGRLAKRLAPFVEYRTALNDAIASDSGSDDALKAASADLDTDSRQRDTYTLDADTISEDFYRKARFIEKIELTNIRAIRHLELTPAFSETGIGSWLMLLGENGAGKSTVLQAIACALIGQKGVDSLDLKASAFLRRGCARGEVRIHVTGLGSPITLTVTRGSDQIFVDPPEPKLMILGYGATRLLTGASQPAEGRIRFKVRNLFDPYTPLSDGRPWLQTASRKKFNGYARSLSALLPRQDAAKFRRSGGEVYVEMPGSRNALHALSSGYQAVLALVLDIMSVMRHGWDDMGSAEGIVLIDEIDAHLHPRWKMKIVPLLRQLFPRIQFIATSHEPLTLRSLDAVEVAVLRRSPKGEVYALQSDDVDLPAPRFMRIDQLLTSELFGLHSAEDPDVDAMFEKYYDLLTKRSLAAEERKELKDLKQALADKRQMGTTQRERIVLEAADKFLAKRELEKKEQSPETSNAARLKLKALWADLNRQQQVTGATQVKRPRKRTA